MPLHSELLCVCARSRFATWRSRWLLACAETHRPVPSLGRVWLRSGAGGGVQSPKSKVQSRRDEFDESHSHAPPRKDELRESHFPLLRGLNLHGPQINHYPGRLFPAAI